VVDSMLEGEEPVLQLSKEAIGRVSFGTIAGQVTKLTSGGRPFACP
jgi:hypothetical protein